MLYCNITPQLLLAQSGSSVQSRCADRSWWLHCDFGDTLSITSFSFSIPFSFLPSEPAWAYCSARSWGFLSPSSTLAKFHLWPITLLLFFPLPPSFSRLVSFESAWTYCSARSADILLPWPSSSPPSFHLVAFVSFSFLLPPYFSFLGLYFTLHYLLPHGAQLAAYCSACSSFLVWSFGPPLFYLSLPPWPSLNLSSPSLRSPPRHIVWLTASPFSFLSPAPRSPILLLLLLLWNDFLSAWPWDMVKTPVLL